MMHGLPRRQGTRVAAAALVAALAIAACGSAASSGAVGAQAPARSGSSSSLASGSATLQRASVDSETAAAQPPISDVGYNTCANIASTTSPPQLNGPFAVSAQVAGWADAVKLGGSLPLGYPVTGLAESEGSTEGYYSALGVPGADGQLYVCNETLLQLDYAGQREFPPVTATFMEYGTIPVIATAYFVQDGPAPLKTVLYQLEVNNAGTTVTGATYTTLVTTAQVSLRVTQVKVNGVPLDVGAHCQTSRPVYTPDPALDPGDNQLILSGGNTPGEPSPREQNVIVGGAQAGLTTVPPFAGCVTPSGENLDALLDSSLSGPGNYTSVIQGPLCAQELSPANCATPTAFNEPLYAPLWTVAHGGPYSSATATLTIKQRVAGVGNETFTCPDSAISGDLPNAAGPFRGPAGTFRWTGTLDCTGPGGSSWTITQEGTALLDADRYQAATQTAYGTADDITLDVRGPATAQQPKGCTAQLTGSMAMYYADGTGSLTLTPTGTVVSTSGGAAITTAANSTCAQLPAGSNSPSISVTYPLGSGTVITSP